MSRKKKPIKEETTLINGDCLDCIDALVICVNESDPATRAMYKQKSHNICKNCSLYLSLPSNKK